MGTAGHIDHGKTSLIKALTGINCDRLAEEQKRGITIELGFAHLDLTKPDGDSERIGIIDVPGHEKFVRNMVAGASGIDFVMLVIAADEGVMPQTREHLEICSMLQIKNGLIVLTKIDMVDSDLLALAVEDVKDFVKNSFLAEAPVFQVSSHTGAGLTELKEGILTQIKNIQPKKTTDIFRLPVDRVFSLKGHGTTITGTLLSGQARLGEEVEILPSKLPSKIRSIQNHGSSVELAEFGHRISLNLLGLEVSDIARGNVIARPGSLCTSKKWIVALHCLKSSPKGLKHRKEVHFHHGTKEVLARLYFYLDENKQIKEILNPGETALCEVHLSEPLCGIFLDNCIIRSFSPLQTIAGAIIINPLENFPKRSQVDLDWQDKLQNLPEKFAENNLEETVFTQIYFGNKDGIEFSKLLILTNLTEKNLDKVIQALISKQKVFSYDKEKKMVIAHQHFESICQMFLTQIAKFHESEPLKEFMPKAELFSKHSDLKLAHFVLEKLQKQSQIITDNLGVRLKNHSIALKESENTLKNTIAAQFTKDILNPPGLKELLTEHKIAQKDMLQVLYLLIQEKKIVKIIENMYFDYNYLESVRQKIKDFFTSNTQMTPNDFKSISGGLTRKYSIPVLEYFDKEKLTIRVGDARILRKVSE